MTEQSTISCHLHYVARQNGFSCINIRVSGQAGWSRACVNFTQKVINWCDRHQTTGDENNRIWILTSKTLDLNGGKGDSNNLDVRI